MKGGVRMAKNETKNIITKEAIEKDIINAIRMFS